MNKTTIFPFGENINSIRILQEIVPSDKFIDIDVDELTKEHIKSLDLYISYTFENIKYDDFEKVASKFDSMVDDMNQYDLILAPGDSPAKYINAIKLLKFKTPPIILFPASSIDTDPNVKTVIEYSFFGYSKERLIAGGKTSELQLDNYLRHILREYNNIFNIRNI